MIQNTDGILYQTEEIQGKDPNYMQPIKTLVHNVKQMKLGIPVWVQVSVNPPFNRQLDTNSVIAVIRQLEDGKGDNPDEIQVFYSSVGKIPGKIAVMEQVIKAFRIAK